MAFLSKDKRIKERENYDSNATRLRQYGYNHSIMYVMCAYDWVQFTELIGMSREPSLVRSSAGAEFEMEQLNKVVKLWRIAWGWRR